MNYRQNLQKAQKVQGFLKPHFAYRHSPKGFFYQFCITSVGYTYLYLFSGSIVILCIIVNDFTYKFMIGNDDHFIIARNGT